MRIPNITRAAINLAGVRLRRAERHWRTVERAVGRLGRQARRQHERFVRAPELARARLRQGRAALERSRKRIDRFDDHVVTPYRAERRIKYTLARAAAGSRPVIAGPWTSEVGYEALYWRPFLAWAADRYGVRPERMIALSRGGTEPWYRGIADRYVEIFDLVEPSEFAGQVAARRDRGDQKQMALSEFDRELIRLATTRLGVRDAVVWHPGLMYQMFRAFWYGDRSLDFLFRHTDFRRMPVTEPAAIKFYTGPALPVEYAAVKFYTGPALPDTDANRASLYDLVQRVAARMPVVVLETTWSVDEHRDHAFEGIRGVTTLRPSLDPKTNLGVQTQVIAGARQFIGTCGGLAWLAPLLGVDTLAVYEDDRYLTAHLYAAKYAYRRTGAARFSTLNLKALRALGRRH
ncbi:MAG: hypothetical protein HW394_917 [Acidobacteria bacterium]|nr:hypothetical protein [Acidobacteriota bacterium]